MVTKPRLKFTELETDANAVRLDLGCGKGATTPEGFEKIDIQPCKGVRVIDLRQKWPWKSNSVDEAQANYLIHYFTMKERIHFMNELHRVLKVGSKAVIFTPHWCAARAYGDPNAKYPPVSEAWYPWLNKAWRENQNLIDTSGLTCDFDHGPGYGLHPAIIPRNFEYQQNAVMFWKEAAQDLIVTLTKL